MDALGASRGGRARSTTCGGAALFIHIITLSEGFSPRATRPPAFGWHPCTLAHCSRAVPGASSSPWVPNTHALLPCPREWRGRRLSPSPLPGRVLPWSARMDPLSLGARWSRACWEPTHHRCTRADTNIQSHCLPNHCSRSLAVAAVAKGVGGGPRFQVDQGLLLEITRDANDTPSIRGR